MSEIEILNMRNTPCVPSQIVRYLAEHPELIGMYRGKAISRDAVIQRIWQANGWKGEQVGQQMKLF